MIRALMGDVVTVVRRAADGKNKFGHAVTVELSRVSYPARVQRRVSEETRETVTNSWVAYLPGSADVQSFDVVEHEGSVYAVDGAPQTRSIPGFPGLTHTRVYMLQREGETP